MEYRYKYRSRHKRTAAARRKRKHQYAICAKKKKINLSIQLIYQNLNITKQAKYKKFTDIAQFSWAPLLPALVSRAVVIRLMSA